MNHAFMVNDSISPSTHRTASHTQASEGFASFRDIYEKGLSNNEDEVNISSSAKNLFAETTQKTPNVDNQIISATEESETKELFDRMQYLLMLGYIGEDPSEEDEESSEEGGGGMTEAASTEADDALEEYVKLRQSIERTRDEALERNGTDKNKYAFAVESYEKAKGGDEGVEEKILTNGQVVKESAEVKSTKIT